MNGKLEKAVGTFIDVINGCFTITLLVLLFIVLSRSLNLVINSWILLLIICTIYIIGIYVSRNLLTPEKNISFKKRLITNILLIISTASCQYMVVNYTGYSFRFPFNYLILFNILSVFVLGTIFHYSLKLISKYK